MGLFSFFKKKNDVSNEISEYESKNKNLCDNNFITPNDDKFLLIVDDVFSITGRGTVAVGLISNGTVNLGDTVTIEMTDGQTLQTTVKGIEMFRKIVETASKGQNVGILLNNIDRNQISKGDKIIKM